LKEKDPEFFNFLAENDAQALGFGQEDEDDFSDEEVVDENLDLDELEADEQDFRADVGSGTIEVSMDMLKKVITKSVTGHYDSIRKLVKMFKAACIPSDSDEGNEEDDDGPSASNRNGYVIPSGEMYNEIMVQVLANAHVSFRAVLGLSPSADIPSGGAKNHPKWKKVQLLVLSFFKSVLHLLNKFSISQQDDQIVAFLIDKLENYISFLFAMPRLAKATLKALLGVWCQDVPTDQQHSNSRGHAFLRIMQMAKTLPGSMLEECFRSMYLAFSRSSKTFSEMSSGTVLFMSECIAALYSTDIAMAYQQSFLYIRQLALHLRAALAKKSAESVKLIASWQYLNCLRVWTKVICTLPAKSQLGELGFPIIQIILGVIASCTSPYYYPLRFHLVTCLHQLSASCQVFVPTSTTLLEILECPDLFAKPSPSTELPPNLRYLVKLPTDSLNRASVRDLVVAETIALLSHDAELCRYNVGFPEYAFVTIKKLRSFAKKVKNSKWRDLARALVSQLEEQSSNVKRDRVKAVMAGSLSGSFEQLLPANGVPVAQRLAKLLATRIAHSISLSASSVKLGAQAGQKRPMATTAGSKKRGKHQDGDDEDDEDDEDEEFTEDEDDQPKKKQMKPSKQSSKGPAPKEDRAGSKKNKKMPSKGHKGAAGKSTGEIEGIHDTVNSFMWSDDEDDA
jgi:nucleolar complex protein 2